MPRFLFVFAFVVHTAACGNTNDDAPPRGGQTSVHEGEITTNETWLAKDNPHFVKSTIYIAGSKSPVVTIEAGVVVQFAAGTSIVVGSSEPGVLMVNGTQDKPVRFVANTLTAQPGHYVGIEFDQSATIKSTLTYLEMENCGGDANRGWTPACIGARGATSHKFDHVSIASSASLGIALEDQASFDKASSTLDIKATADDSLFLSDPNAVASIPAGSTFTKSIRVGALELIGKTQRWANHGSPYIITGELRVEGASRPILSIAPGTTLRFSGGSGLIVGAAEGGDLKAEGTEEARIVFTSESSVSGPGQWAGLSFDQFATSASSLKHAVVEYGGQDVAWAYAPANVQVIEDKGPIVTNTLIRASKTCGIVRGVAHEFTTDFTASSHGNVFENNIEGNQCDD